MANDWFESGKAGTELTEEDVNRNWFNQGEPEWWKYNTADTTPYAETKTQGVLNSLAGGFYDSSRDLYGNAPAMMRNLPAAVRTVASAGVIPSWLPHPTLNPGGEQRAQLDEMRTELSRQSTMFPGSKEGQVKYSPQWFYENLGRMAVPMGTQVAVGAATGPAGYVGASFIQAAGGQYEQAFERNKQRGYSDEEAGKRASTEALAVGITSAAIDRFGYAWTLDKFKGKGFLKSVAEKLDGTPVARTIRGGLGELGAEGTQEGAALVVESIADMENYLTSENFWNRVVPNSILGFAAGSTVRGGVEAKGFATDTATVGARGDRKYSLTTEDAVKLVRTDPVAATEIAKSSRAGVNDFAKWGVERGQGNRKEATAQRKKFQEEVKRELDVVTREARQQQEAQSVAQPAGPETSVPNPNQTDVPTADTQTPQAIDQTQTTEEAPVRASEKMLARRIARALPGDTNANTDQVLQQLRQDPEGLKQELEGKPGAKSLIQKIEGYQEKQVAQQERQPDEIGRLPSAFLVADPEQITKFIKWADRKLTKRGLLSGEPTKMRQFREWAIQRVRADHQQAKHNRRDLEKAVKKEYGKPIVDLDPSIYNLISDALNDTRLADQLPESIKIPLMNYRHQIDSLTKHLIDMGMTKEEVNEVMNGNIGVYTTRAFRIWTDPKWVFEKIPKFIIEDAKKFFKQHAPVGADTSDAKLEQAVRDFIADRKNDNPILKGLKVGSNDLTSLLKRSDIPEPILGLLGEIKDPRAKAELSVLKLSNMIAKFELQQNLREFGLGNFLWERNDPNRPVEANYEIASEGNEAMGVLAGLMTTEGLKQQFDNIEIKQKNTNEIFALLSRASLTSKVALTVYAPFTAIRNYTSNGWNLFATGTVPTKERIANALKAVTGYDREMQLDAIKYGLIGDSVAIGEYRALLNDANKRSEIEQMILDAANMNISANKLWRLVKGKVKLVDKGFKAFYTNGDTLPKLIAWQQEMDNYRHLFNNEEDLKAHAAETVKRIWQTYNRVWKWAEWFRVNPVVGTFVSFPAEVLRSRIELAKLIMEEGRSGDPKLRAVATKRLGGWSLAYLIPLTASVVTAAWADVSDEEDDALRTIKPEWEKANSFIYYRMKDGKFTRDKSAPIRTLDITNSHTDSIILKPLIALRKQGLKEALQELTNPFISWDISTKAFMEMAIGYESDTGSPVTDSGLSDTERAKQLGAYYWDNALEPGLVRDGSMMLGAYTGKKGYSGKSIGKLEAWARVIGIRASMEEPDVKAYYIVNEWKKTQYPSNRHFTKLAKNKGYVSDDEMRQGFLRMEESRYRNFQEMRKGVMAAITLSNSDTKSVLNAIDASEETKKRIIADAYEPWKPTNDFMKQVPQERREQVIRIYREASVEAANRRERATDRPRWQPAQ